VVWSTQGWTLDYRTPRLRIVSLRTCFFSGRFGFYGFCLGPSGWRAGSSFCTCGGLVPVPSGGPSGFRRMGWPARWSADGHPFMAILLGLGPSGEATQWVALEWLARRRNPSQPPGRLSKGLSSAPVELRLKSLRLNEFSFMVRTLAENPAFFLHSQTSPKVFPGNGR